MSMSIDEALNEVESSFEVDKKTGKPKRTLTNADIEALCAMLECHTCSFSEEEQTTLRNMATNIDNAQKIATKTIITALVLSVLGGIGFAIKHLLLEILHTGSIHGN